VKITALDLRQQEDKAGALRQSWRTSCYRIDPSDLAILPRTPLAYWATRSALAAFRNYGRFAELERVVTSTNPMNSDFRYARCWWEVSFDAAFMWRAWAKGGPFARFYRDVDMIVAWDELRQTYRGFLGTANRPLERPASCQYFFRPGLTWSRRSQIGLSLRALPAMTVFGDKGPYVGNATGNSDGLLEMLAVSNSAIFAQLVNMQMAFGSFEVGVLQRTPFPVIPLPARERLAVLARSGWSSLRSLDTAVEVSHAFMQPALLGVHGASFGERVSAWSSLVCGAEADVALVQSEIDELCCDLYGISDEDRRTPIEVSSPAELHLETEPDAIPEGVRASRHEAHTGCLRRPQSAQGLLGSPGRRVGHPCACGSAQDYTSTASQSARKTRQTALSANSARFPRPSTL
jgi:hypothetical protein